MDYMFSDAVSFKQELCGDAWVKSKASKTDMFAGSSGSISVPVCAAFASKAELKSAVYKCLQLSQKGDCFNARHGAIAEWDVSSVTDMTNLFAEASFQWGPFEVGRVKCNQYDCHVFDCVVV